jgi:hypothetical protein
MMLSFICISSNASDSYIKNKYILKICYVLFYILHKNENIRFFSSALFVTFFIRNEN